MDRFTMSEISPSRLLGGFIRRAKDIPHSIAWWFSAGKNLGRLSRFVNAHNGERCFIMANGPSLGHMDLSYLAGEVTIGLNRIYLLFDKLIFRPTYYVCINELVLEQFSDEIKGLNMPKFLNWNRRNLYDSYDTSTYYVKLSLGLQDKFAIDFHQSFSGGGTVTYVALQIAYLMGFSQVVLVGLDHSFGDKGTPNKVEVRQSREDKNHFHPDYFPKGSKWQLPDLRRSEIAYKLADEVYRRNGRKIVDATIGGKCPVFEKADYFSLF